MSVGLENLDPLNHPIRHESVVAHGAGQRVNVAVYLERGLLIGFLRWLLRRCAQVWIPSKELDAVTTTFSPAIDQ